MNPDISSFIATSANTETTQYFSDMFKQLSLNSIVTVYLPRIFTALLIYVIGMILTKVFMKFLDNTLKLSKVDKVLFPLIKLIAKMIIYVIIFISCVDALHIPVTSLITALGAVGLAVSLAVKDSLSNLTSGVVVILSKPFALDDYVQIGDSEGTVKEIGFFYTVLGTIDNKKVMIPNSQVSSSKVVNYSAEKMRRLDLTFSIGYEDDIKRAKQIVLDEIENNPLSTSEPMPPFVGVASHSASSIDLTARIWVATEDYWTLKFELLESVKYAFDNNNISIPFNQLDVHITK